MLYTVHQGQNVEMAPLRILSFDIETAVRILPNGKDLFPDSKTDQVFQISNMITIPGT